MKITSFTVLPDTPKKLKPLHKLAYNMYFSWNADALELFRKLDPESWKDAHDNPVRMLCLVPQEKLEAAAEDQAYQAELSAIYERFNSYMSSTTWFERQYGKRNSPVIAYFSAEYGIHECLPIYSGGLGVLSGDHVKSASDLGIPLVAVGLLYSQGYFRQHLNADGLQQEWYPENDWYSKPVHLVKDENGIPLKGSIDLAGEAVYFHIWRVDVGRVFLYLLDTNLNENKPKHREITKMLYDPDRDTRIRQEILLGIGGTRALKLLGYNPLVYHANEGHSAFLLLERIRQLIQEHHLSYDEAKQIVWSSSLFTTHTPVPAGNEAFSLFLMQNYFKDYIKDLGISWDEFLAYGRETADNKWQEFSMTILALNLTAYSNGVSKLHGQVSQKMWHKLYRDIPEDEIPIGAVVNGVHARTWLAPQMHNLFLRYGGPSSLNELADFNMWNITAQIPDDELWSVREQNRRQLIAYARKRLQMQYQRRGVHAGELNKMNDVLDPKALTIGMARRFVTYKRGYLFFKNLKRLKQIMCSEDRPVQLIIAGKAHPADQMGKDIIKQIFEIANTPEFKNRIAFLEDYDLDVASFMVQGVDVWLNTPRRPMEACGTSGMKVAMNGGLNVSILDGWWDEAYTPELGWAIGERQDYSNFETQDQIESDLLYTLLEREIIPTFYQRDDDNIPREWLKMMKTSMKALGTGFNSHRMLRDYTERYYLKALDFHTRLSANEFTEAKNLAQWRQKIVHDWSKIEIMKVESLTNDFIFKGNKLDVRAWIKLGEISHEDVVVECYHGPLDIHHKIDGGQKIRMTSQGKEGDLSLFAAAIPCSRGGRYGFTVRILAGNKNLAVNKLPGFIRWYD